MLEHSLVHSSGHELRFTIIYLIKLVSGHCHPFEDQSPSEPPSSGIGNGSGTGECGDRDEKYWERRRKNNIAAKKSRDARKIRENQLKVKVNCLQNANQVLRDQVERDKQEINQMKHKMSNLMAENMDLRQKLMYYSNPKPGINT